MTVGNESTKKDENFILNCYILPCFARSNYLLTVTYSLFVYISWLPHTDLEGQLCMSSEIIVVSMINSFLHVTGTYQLLLLG